MLWRSDPINEHDGQADFTLVLGRLPLAGGPIAEVARGEFSGPVYHFYGNLRGFRITSLIPTPDGIFIADFRRGLLVVRDGKIKAWTESDGLATDQIWSLAWAGNTLYAGADNGFMIIDPQTGKCTILASGKAPSSATNPFQGGTPYRIVNILPAPDGSHLWLAVGGDIGRTGLWRYDMDSETYEHIVHLSDNDPHFRMAPTPGPSLTWHDGNLLMIGRAGDNLTGMGIIDARTGMWLRTFYGTRAWKATVEDSFPDERDARNVWKPIDFTPQHRVALTSIGFIVENGDAVDPMRDNGYHADWHLEQPADWSEGSVLLSKSHIATPELCRPWKTIEEVGSGVLVASYGDAAQRPVL